MALRFGLWINKFDWHPIVDGTDKVNRILLLLLIKDGPELIVVVFFFLLGFDLGIVGDMRSSV